MTSKRVLLLVVLCAVALTGCTARARGETPPPQPSLAQLPAATDDGSGGHNGNGGDNGSGSSS